MTCDSLQRFQIKLGWFVYPVLQIELGKLTRIIELWSQKWPYESCWLSSPWCRNSLPALLPDNCQSGLYLHLPHLAQQFQSLVFLWKGELVFFPLRFIQGVYCISRELTVCLEDICQFCLWGICSLSCVTRTKGSLEVSCRLYGWDWGFGQRLCI